MPRINHLPATEHHLHVSVYCVKRTRVLIALPSLPARSTLSNDVSETQGWEDGICTSHLSGSGGDQESRSSMRGREGYGHISYHCRFPRHNRDPGPRMRCWEPSGTPSRAVGALRCEVHTIDIETSPLRIPRGVSSISKSPCITSLPLSATLSSSTPRDRVIL